MREVIYRIFETLLTQVASLFPYEHFYIGGDELT